MGLTQK